ncbi:MAG: hypothetical protein HC795_11660 [Coleofasciculaceae cyanobacterium RL_1_1]|nr:hypothetical protein [Coleofasciculaceae cyanobacterium RL_1_1]
MNHLQTQIATLDHKVDALYTLIERLSSSVDYLLKDASTRAHGADTHNVDSERMLSRDTSKLDAMFEHQDVLLDRDLVSTERHGDEDTKMTPEAQIQRLTAQLTASYNRIAALEEQLLSLSNVNYRQR